MWVMIRLHRQVIRDALYEMVHEFSNLLSDSHSSAWTIKLCGEADCLWLCAHKNYAHVKYVYETLGHSGGIVI